MKIPYINKLNSLNDYHVIVLGGFYSSYQKNVPAPNRTFIVMYQIHWYIDPPPPPGTLHKGVEILSIYQQCLYHGWYVISKLGYLHERHLSTSITEKHARWALAQVINGAITPKNGG